jgi:hypothetical protein
MLRISLVAAELVVSVILLSSTELVSYLERLSTNNKLNFQKILIISIMTNACPTCVPIRKTGFTVPLTNFQGTPQFMLCILLFKFRTCTIM